MEHYFLFFFFALKFYFKICPRKTNETNNKSPTSWAQIFPRVEQAKLMSLNPVFVAE